MKLFEMLFSFSELRAVRSKANTGLYSIYKTEAVEKRGLVEKFLDVSET